MPTLTPAEKARYRTTPHASQTFLYAFVPTVIFAAEVNNAPAPGVVNIDYDTVTVGAYTVIEGGETLLVGSSAGGSDIGRLRVRGATAGHLIVAWDSDILWSNNQHLTVLREFLPWRRQQRNVAGVVAKDYDVPWTGQTTQWPPAPLMGDATIKLFRPGDPSPQLYMADRGSYPMAPGATITAHAWVMPGGTPATSASSTPGLVTVSAPIKDYWKLSVTDTNGKVSSGRRPIVVVDPANCYTEFVCESLEDNIDGGVVARFRVFGDAQVTAFPPRCSIFYFTEDYYGNGYGEHIKFFGYIVERSVKKDPETSDITFTAASCVSIADKLVVSASELHDVVTPSSWQEAKSLTVRRSLFHLIYFHSTLFQVADVFIAADPTPQWYTVFPEGTLWGLMNTLARTWRALRCGVTKRGRVVIGVDPQMRAVADRGVVTEVMQLQHGDWHGEIDPVITDFPPYAFFAVDAFYYDGVPGVAKEQLVLSIAPGHPDKEFGGKDAFPGMVSNGQLESNQFAGLMLGQKNNPYSPFKIELVGNWWEAFEPAFQEYLVAPAGGWPTNAFPALLDSARLIVRGMSQSDAPDGVQLTTLLVEPESFPEQAVDGDYPPPFTPPCDDCEIPCVGCDPPAPVPPTVDFVGDPLTGCVPFTVTFTPTIGGGTVTGSLWDFGDGAFSTLAAPTHSYTVPGTYSVSLGVDFLEGDYVEATKAAYITATVCASPTFPRGVWTLFEQGDIYRLDSVASGAGIATSKPAWKVAYAPTRFARDIGPGVPSILNVLSDIPTFLFSDPPISALTLHRSTNDGSTFADTLLQAYAYLRQLRKDPQDSNAMWIVVVKAIDESLLISQISSYTNVAYNNGNILFNTNFKANTGDILLYYSANGGASWTQVFLAYLSQLWATQIVAGIGGHQYIDSTNGGFVLPDITTWDALLNTPGGPYDATMSGAFVGVDPTGPANQDALGYWLINVAGIQAASRPLTSKWLTTPEHNVQVAPDGTGQYAYVVMSGWQVKREYVSVEGSVTMSSILNPGFIEPRTHDYGAIQYEQHEAHIYRVHITDGAVTTKVASRSLYSLRTGTLEPGLDVITVSIVDLVAVDYLYSLTYAQYFTRWRFSTNTSVTPISLQTVFGSAALDLFCTSQGTLLAATSTGHIWRSTNKGVTWTDIDVSAIAPGLSSFHAAEYGGMVGGGVGAIVVPITLDSDSSGRYVYSLDDGLTWERTSALTVYDVIVSGAAR